MQPRTKAALVLAALGPLLAGLARPVAAQAETPPVDPCPAVFAPEGDLAARFDQADREVRACVDAGRLTSRAGRRGLAAIAQLRELALYDERRAWGTDNARREHLYDLRLRALMAATRR